MFEIIIILTILRIYINLFIYIYSKFNVSESNKKKKTRIIDSERHENQLKSVYK